MEAEKPQKIVRKLVVLHRRPDAQRGMEMITVALMESAVSSVAGSF